MWGPLLKNTKVSQVEAQAAAPVKKKKKKSRQLSLPQAKTLAFDGNSMYYVIYHG
jgi:hypothetical protein